MWEISSSNQAVTFLLSLALGVFLSLLYDAFKSLRLSFRHGVFAVALEDILFFALATFLSFCLFMLRTKAEPRGYAYFAMALGFLLWRISLSRKNVKLLCRVIGIVKTIFSKISESFSRFFDKIRLQSEKVSKKFVFCVKKGLKGVKRMVYNLIKRIIGK